MADFELPTVSQQADLGRDELRGLADLVSTACTCLCGWAAGGPSTVAPTGHAGSAGAKGHWPGGQSTLLS